MNRYDAMQIFTDSKKEAIEVQHISITRTTRAVKMILHSLYMRVKYQRLRNTTAEKLLKGGLNNVLCN